MSRAKGWIQDPGRLENLIKVVDAFNHRSETHSDLIRNRIPRLVQVDDGRNVFINELNSRNGYLRNPKISYKNLVGTAFTPRSSARCNGIIQALIPGQRRAYISDWPANNFVRWAEALGFIQHIEADDAYTITDKGLLLSNAGTTNQKFNVIKDSLLQYPPAIRILELLYNQFTKDPNNPLLTKFELGAELGFRGEDGFTTYPQKIVIQRLATFPDEKNKILSDWEGTSDKYARGICGWLSHSEIKWVKNEAKTVTEIIANQNFITKIPQSYQITTDGILAFRKCRARSKHRGVPKKVFFEMLAIKEFDVDYLRMRRGKTIKYLKDWRKVAEIQKHLQINKIGDVPSQTILDDIVNFQRLGLEIEHKRNYYKIKDEIVDLKIPVLQTTASNVTITKQQLSQDIQYVNHNFFDLLDLCLDKKQSRLFELRIVEILNLIITAKHLSGGNRPEIIGYYPNENSNECIIMDSKAYANGFSIPAQERDKMIRYITEYNEKDESLNPNKWWENFQSPKYPNRPVVYAFVSSNFIGNFVDQLNYILLRTKAGGGAITAETLIRKIESVLNPNENYNIQSFFKDVACNNLVI